MTPDPSIILALTMVCICAGFIDAIAGGGGLLTVPAMLFAGIPPIHALATNKLQSVCGTFMAWQRFSRAGLVDWRTHGRTLPLILAGAAAGCLVVQAIDAPVLQLIVPLLLAAVALYILFSPRMTDEASHPRLSESGYGPVGSLIGFYDGFFGPGTGAFFTATLVGLRGEGLTSATGKAKLFNLISNLASVALFALGGKMFWILGLSMAAGSALGANLGAHTAMRFGARVIRPFLVAISLALTARVLWSYVAAII